jgi:DNA-binding GntR family transcriptional regulator
MTLQIFDDPVDALVDPPAFQPGGPSMTGHRRSKAPLKRNQVRQQLQDMILGGAWSPGSRLGQEELASRFRAAQGLVREVLVELRATGLVESSDFRGAIVPKLDKDKLIEACELRAMHEAIAVRRCCERLTRADLRELTELAERIHKASVAGKVKLAALLDRELHDQFLQRCQSGMLLRLADNYQLLCRAVRDDRKPAVIRDEHLAILRAIEAGRADDADQLVRKHIAHERRWVQRHFNPERLA